MKTITQALAGLALVAGLAAPATAQTGEVLIKQVGASKPIPNPTHPGDPKLVYKVAWDVTEAPAKPDERVARYATPANFLVMADENGIPRANVHLAIIVHGTATQSLLMNDAYKVANGVDNPNVALLQALNDAGVQIIVCGQALLNRKVPRDKLLPFVKVSTSATLARATLHAQGYATFQ